MSPNVENIIVIAITKRMEIVISIQVSRISRMNFDYKKNGGKKIFYCKSKHEDRVSQCGEHDCSANDKNNEDYY